MSASRFDNLVFVAASEKKRCCTPSTAAPSPQPCNILEVTTPSPVTALELQDIYVCGIRVVYCRGKEDLGPMYSKMKPSHVRRLFPSLREKWYKE